MRQTEKREKGVGDREKGKERKQMKRVEREKNERKGREEMNKQMDK